MIARPCTHWYGGQMTKRGGVCVWDKDNEKCGVPQCRKWAVVLVMQPEACDQEHRTQIPQASICPFCRWVYITTYFTWHIITSYRLIVNDPNAHCNRIPGIWCHSRRNHRSEPEWTNLSYYRRIEFKFFIVSTSRHQAPPGVGVGVWGVGGGGGGATVSGFR